MDLPICPPAGPWEPGSCPHCESGFVTTLTALVEPLWFCEWCGHEWVPASELHVLYRFYGEGDALLYIGITNSPWSRFKAHQREKPWFNRVVRAVMEHFPTRELLAVAEVRAIEAERPMFNIAHARSVA